MSILDRTRTNSSHPASRQSPSKLRRADRGAAGASAAVLGVADELGRMSNTFKTVVVVP
jgi:hypothetical protein